LVIKADRKAPLLVVIRLSDAIDVATIAKKAKR